VPAVLLLFAVPVLTVGCGWLDRPSGVAIIGDSITDQVAPDIGDGFAGQDVVEVRAVPGATIRDMLGEAARMSRGTPGILVVNLGTNDVLRGVPPERSAADLETMLDTFPSAECVVLISVHEYMFSFTEGFLTERAAATNAALAEVAAERGVTVVDWTAAIATAQSDPDAPDVLIDTIHLSTAGVDLLEGIYADAITDTCGVAPPVSD
jgi:lysophospholipase L1-like esterase